MVSTYQRPEFRASFYTPFMETRGACLELFYILESYYSLTQLTVKVLTEELHEQIVAKTNNSIWDWSRLFVELPEGVHRVIIEGYRGHKGSSSLSLDDIIIKNCSSFGKHWFKVV